MNDVDKKLQNWVTDGENNLALYFCDINGIPTETPVILMYEHKRHDAVKLAERLYIIAYDCFVILQGRDYDTNGDTVLWEHIVTNGDWVLSEVDMIRLRSAIYRYTQGFY